MTGPFCPVCAKKWGRQLWSGSCICTGHVILPVTTIMDFTPIIRPTNPAPAMGHKHAEVETAIRWETDPRNKRRKK